MSRDLSRVKSRHLRSMQSSAKLCHVTTKVTLFGLRQKTVGPDTGKRRKHPYMTLKEVEAATGVDEKTLIKLEGETRPMSAHYARQLEAVYGEQVWATLPEPEEISRLRRDEDQAEADALGQLHSRLGDIEETLVAHDAAREQAFDHLSEQLDTVLALLRGQAGSQGTGT